ncbi:T9SS type A sorting domain-containing protein [Persicobacter psychrovividus]|uniref:GH16 domain-containing protein n=1 Tax=Persicobacter psychrovividus TaxID=387638 RepID=A0ABN6LGP3_9BACT|nr:hypothetical protein PEPS_45640 [Persicobacter psychrovividus]
MRIFPTAIFLAFFVHMAFQSQAQAPNAQYKLFYEDNFNSNQLNESDWMYRDMTSEYMGGYNRHENVSVETNDGVGYLRIDYNQWDVNKDGKEDIVGGGIISRKAFGYGYYEARILFYDQTKGLHQSFWTYGLTPFKDADSKFTYKEDARHDLVPWTNAGLEIDGIEFDSDYNAGSGNFHWHRPVRTTPRTALQHFSSDYLDASDWVTIGFEWRPGEILWYVNGELRNRFSYNDDRYGPQEVWFSALANNVDYFGGGGIPADDAHMKVDYFRYYTAPFDTNLISNWNFEANGGASKAPIGWIKDDGVYDNVYSDGAEVVFDKEQAYNGEGFYHYKCQAGKPMSTKQNLWGIADGRYKMTAYIKSSGGMKEAKMRATVGENIFETLIPETNEWTKIVLDDIVVKNNLCVIDFYADGNSGQWLMIDQVEFVTKEMIDWLPNDLVIDNGDQGYSELSGTWWRSDHPGYGGSSTYSSNVSGASAKWVPEIKTNSFYDVYIYKIVDSNSDQNSKIDIVYDGGKSTKYIDYTSGESGWVYLGKYPFDLGTDAYVQNTLNSSGKFIRTDAVKFVLSDPPLSVGLEEVDINIFPNPTTNKLNVNSSVELNTITIYTVNGLKVAQQELNENGIVDVSFLNNGIYLIVLENNYNKYTKRFIKN